MTSLALRSSRPLFLHRRAVVGRRMRCPCAVPGGQGDPQPQASTSGQVGSDFALHPFQSQLAGKSFMCTMCGK